MKRKINKSAISLITLVITIIIMIILAGAIVVTLSNSGIFNKANDAVNKYNLKEVQAMMDLVWADTYKDETTTADELQKAVNKALRDNNLDDKYQAVADKTGVVVTEKPQGSKTVIKDMDEVIGNIQDTNVKVYDEFGNQIVIPAGFMVRVDEDEGIKGDAKTTATNVTQGVVIEDAVGNQFVWVPVGTIYTTNDDATREATAKTITLGRYAGDKYKLDEFKLQGENQYIMNEDGIYTPSDRIFANIKRTWVETSDGENFDMIDSFDVVVELIEEEASETGLGKHGNAIARNIKDFVKSATQNGGYYIGRFEASNLNNLLTCKSDQEVYTTNQVNASELCKGMYNGGADGYSMGTFSSDLVNSYAWDTAIIFIQTFSGDGDYYGENIGSDYWPEPPGIKLSGEAKDEVCNINDMSTNFSESSTETIDYTTDKTWAEAVVGHSTTRGGVGDMNYAGGTGCTSDRGYGGGVEYACRPIIYVAICE